MHLLSFLYDIIHIQTKLHHTDFNLIKVQKYIMKDETLFSVCGISLCEMSLSAFS